MTDFDLDDELARCVCELLDRGAEVDARFARRSHSETAETIRSFAAVSDVAPEQLPPSRPPSIAPPNAGRYSLIAPRRPGR